LVSSSRDRDDGRRSSGCGHKNGLALLPQILHCKILNATVSLITMILLGFLSRQS
jgi:hypothetical protein